MDIRKLSIQELESYFNLITKMREGIIMMARANNNFNTTEVKFINKTYDNFLIEIKRRLHEFEYNEVLN